MKTYILPESKVEAYYNAAIKDSPSVSVSELNAAIMGLDGLDVSGEMDLEEAKKRIKVGECILLEYDGKLLPFQCIHKYPNNRCVFSSYYVLDNHIFDEKTNVWRDASIRRYMNNEMANKFSQEFLKYVKEHEVHTDDYVTKDKFWLLSHEEIGYKDENHMFKENKGAICFDYYKDNPVADPNGAGENNPSNISAAA